MPGTNDLTLNERLLVQVDSNRLIDTVSSGIEIDNIDRGVRFDIIQARWNRHSCGYPIRCSKSRKWDVIMTTFKLSLPFILPGKEGKV